MRATPVLLMAGVGGVWAGAWGAGAHLHTLFTAGAAALTVSVVIALSARMRREEVRRIMVEIYKVEMKQDLNAQTRAPIDLDDTRAVPVRIGDVDAVVGVSGEVPVADATVLRFAMERARKGVAS